MARFKTFVFSAATLATLMLYQNCGGGFSPSTASGLAESASSISSSIPSSLPDLGQGASEPSPASVPVVTQDPNLVNVSDNAPFTLNPGQYLQKNGVTLVMQADGNLVVYRMSGSGLNGALWNSQTGGRSCASGCKATFQSDGNLVLYQNQTAYWNSQSSGLSGAALILAPTPPYISIQTNAQVRWSGSSNLNWFTALDPSNNYGPQRPGVPDFMQLFQEGSPWQNSLSHINVFKLYSQAYSSLSDADLKTIIAFLARHNIALAVEFPPLTTANPTCSGEGVGGVALASAIATRVKSLGGTLTYVAMDEPLDFFYHTPRSSLAACPFNSIPTMAQNVAQSYVAFRNVFPSIIMGDIENGLTGSASDQQWFDSYKTATGVPLAFFHDDAVMEGAPWKNSIAALQNSLRARAIPYGLIRNGNNEATSNAQWVGIAEARIQLYASLGLPTPEQNIFQSWNPFPTTALPETSNVSLTSVVNYFFPPEAAAGTNTAATLIFRITNAKNADHLFSTSSSEGLGSGYSLDGPAFSLFSQPSATRSRVYRCLRATTGDHFLSTDPGCEGQQPDGALGYLENSLNRLAPHPLFRCMGKTHLETLSALECQNAGLVIEGPIGYAP